MRKLSERRILNFILTTENRFWLVAETLNPAPISLILPWVSSLGICSKHNSNAHISNGKDLRAITEG